jgi:hypothetical protein
MLLISADQALDKPRGDGEELVGVLPTGALAAQLHHRVVGDGGRLKRQRCQRPIELIRHAPSGDLLEISVDRIHQPRERPLVAAIESVQHQRQFMSVLLVCHACPRARMR